VDSAANRDDRVLIAPLLAISAAVIARALYEIPRLDFTSGLIYLALVIIVAACGPYTLQLPRLKTILSPTDPFVFGSMILFGPWLTALIAGLDGVLSTRRHTSRRWSWLASFSVMVLSAGAAGLVFDGLAPKGFRHKDASVDELVLPVITAALVYFLVNTGLVAGVTAWRRRWPILDLWKQNYLWTSISFLASSVAALLGYSAQRSFGGMSLLVVLPLVATVYAFYRAYLGKLASEGKHIRELNRLQEQTMDAFAMAIDTRHSSFRGHARKVQFTAETIAEIVREKYPELAGRTRLDDAWVKTVKAAALLHDIGKLGVPDHILHKTTKLSSAEEEKMRQHPVLGAAILSRVMLPRPVAPIIKSQLERWDGKGFPLGLEGADIPLEARILSLSLGLAKIRQGIDEKSAARIHRSSDRSDEGHSKPVDALISYVARHSGSVFDPHLADLYCAHAEEIETEVARRLVSWYESRETDAGPSVEEIRVIEGIQNAQRESGALFNLARSLGRTLDFEETLDVVIQRLEELMPSYSCALYLADPGGKVVSARRVRGALADTLSKSRFACGEGITGWVFGANEGCLNADPRVDLGRIAEEDPAILSAAAFPIHDQAGPLGVVVFYALEADAFSQDHQRLFENIAPQLAGALRNAMLYEETRVTSMTDALTGLPNSRYLYAQVEKEMSRTMRRGTPLSIVVLDLDGFKPVNDTYGHQAGDLVLQRISDLLRREFRSADTVCRYAGDEFVALLPETDLDDARRIVRRFQEIAEEYEILLPSGESVKVGISAGWASFPVDGSTFEELLHRADKEMYRDKARRGAPSR